MKDIVTKLKDMLADSNTYTVLNNIQNGALPNLIKQIQKYLRK